jgi:hypothetical protein
MKLFLSALLFFQFSTAALAGTSKSSTPPPILPPAPPVQGLRAFPQEIFAQEGTYVLFTTPSTDPNAQLSLIQIDEEGKPLAYAGIMADDKSQGDRVAHDGIFSRKFEINGQKATVLRFTVIVDDGRLTHETFHRLSPLPAILYPRTEVRVTLRPTLPQILKNVWDRWRSPSVEQPENPIRL